MCRLYKYILCICTICCFNLVFGCSLKKVDKSVPTGIPIPQPSPITEQVVEIITPEDSLEAEVTLFDLYLANQYQGLVLTRYTNNWFEIEEPTDAVEQIKKVKNKQELLRLLSKRIFKERKIPGVGTVKFDPNTFRIIIVADPEILAAQTLNLTGRLPDPENKFSFRQDLQTSYSEDFEEMQSNASFTHRTIGSYGNHWSMLDGTAIKGDSYELNEFSANGIVGDWRYEAGLLRTPGLRYTNSADILGVGAYTTEEVYINNDALRGSKLRIYVPSRSRVEFFKGARLLAVQLLDYGLQEVDTNSFPQGSYSIDIVFTEDNGQVSRERKFFTKSGLLAVRDRIGLAAYLGELRSQFDLENIPVYQFGVVWRALDFMQFSSYAYGTDSFTIGSLDLIGLLNDYIFGAGAAYSTSGNSAYFGQFSGELWGVNFGVDYNSTISGSEDLASEVKEDPLLNLDSQLESPIQRLNPIEDRQSDFNAYFSKYFDDIETKFSATSSKGEEEDRYAYGPSVSWKILEEADDTVKFDLSYFRTQEGEETVALISYQHRFAPWTSDIQAVSKLKNDRNEDYLRTIFGYNNQERTGLGTKARFAIEGKHQEQGDDPSLLTNTAEVQYINRYLDTSLFLQDQQLSRNSRTAAGINMSTAVIADVYGHHAVSHPPQGDAAIIVEIESRSSNATMEVLINGSVYSKVQAGTAVVIGLNPFNTYDIGIRPVEGTELVGYDPEPQRVVLFPGNIVTRTWEVERIFIGLGRVVDINGLPIAKARIKGFKDYVVTEEDGSFQAELSGYEKLSINSRNHNCKIEILAPEKIEYFYDFNNLICK